MQDPIELLMSEHRLIERVLDSLDSYAESLAANRETAREDLSKFVTVLRDFGDAEHHAKEEDILFVHMQRHGFSADVGPIAVMLHEHGVGRGLVGVLAEIGEQSPWPDDAVERIRKAAFEFTSMLRMHIQKEDSILYPMAQKTLPPAAYAEVGTACAERAANASEAGRTQRLTALAEELCDKYGPG